MTQLQPCRTESCAWSNWVMRNFSVPPPHGSGRRTQTRLSCPVQPRCLGLIEKSVRDFLGGWSAPASERNARIAARRIRDMQRTVVAELQKGLNDPLSEAETLAQLDGFLSEQGVLEEERSFLQQAVGTWCTHRSVNGQKKSRRIQEHKNWARSQSKCRRNRNTKVVRAMRSCTTYIACLPWARVQRKPETKFQPRSNQASSPSGKEVERTLHQLGRCYLLPGVGYLDYSFACKVMPRSSGYDGVCRLCAREGVRNVSHSVLLI